MENQLQEKVKQSIQILRDKQARIYFLVQDTKTPKPHESNLNLSECLLWKNRELYKANKLKV